MILLSLRKRHKTQSTSPTDGQTCRKTLCLFIFDLWLNIHLLSISVRKMMFDFKFSHSCFFCHVMMLATCNMRITFTGFFSSDHVLYHGLELWNAEQIKTEDSHTDSRLNNVKLWTVWKLYHSSYRLATNTRFLCVWSFIEHKKIDGASKNLSLQNIPVIYIMTKGQNILN